MARIAVSTIENPKSIQQKGFSKVAASEDHFSGLISIYLDVVRFLAAMGVFLSHAARHAGAPALLLKGHFDHKLVIVFFVISGYVIAASAARPGRTLANYAADRLARFSSVAIPALALTWCLDAIGAKVSPSFYSLVDPHWQFVRFLLNLFYCQQIWFICANPGVNGPFWSLGYEFWYYALFAVILFVKSIRARILLLLAMAIFIGPKILLLWPAWALGAIAFHATKGLACSRRNSLMLVVGTSVALVLAVVFEKQLGLDNGKVGQAPLYYSSNFIGDNVLAVVIALHFLSCGLLSRHFTRNLECHATVKLIRWLATHTFSLYLFHMPILIFVRAVSRYDANNLFAVCVALGISLLIIAGLSKVTEERYPDLRTIFRRWAGALAKKFAV